MISIWIKDDDGNPTHECHMSDEVYRIKKSTFFDSAYQVGKLVRLIDGCLTPQNTIDVLGYHPNGIEYVTVCRHDATEACHRGFKKEDIELVISFPDNFFDLVKL